MAETPTDSKDQPSRQEMDLPCGIKFFDPYLAKAYMTLCEEQKASIAIHNLKTDDENHTSDALYYDLPNEFYPEVSFIKKGLNQMHGRFVKVQCGHNTKFYECFSFFYNHPKQVPEFYRGAEIVNIMDNKRTFLCIDSKTMDVLDNKHCYFVKMDDQNSKMETHIAVIYSDQEVKNLDEMYLCSFDPDTMNTEGVMIFGSGRFLCSNDDIKKIRADKIKYLNGECNTVVVANQPSSPVVVKKEEDDDNKKKRKEDKKKIKINNEEVKKYLDQQIQEAELRIKEIDSILLSDK